MTRQIRRIVLTGGPGAGKTAVQQVAQHAFPDRLVTVPESATILFSGGFPRLAGTPARCASQRAIFHVQRELERLHESIANGCALLCDRGTVDGAAYWAGRGDFFEQVGTTREDEIARYHTVIQLAVPSEREGYDTRNPTRIETAREAQSIGERIRLAWEGHPRVFRIHAAQSFWAKVQEAVTRIGEVLDEPDAA
ncbi:MAG TPA: AAA family ATPase [Polyangiaceae bacterium LLY-WYZ-15_(1-7)]|nr:hypothetical protein [Myxococcales bacterium]MAT26827.1 hypothetical protein [Sandaracinus sp.]HJK99861.1 AAA family ATPase [Polyangiaceae bacterium LLY-WYZ-15_(1-7)]MBJ73322.1 hypothetical protein [Sandaracinus sp.]HJL11387.1 AAA family ATPase [Polyangiaceae bacterium LLY-WYZ-15_(1-7)]